MSASTALIHALASTTNKRSRSVNSKKDALVSFVQHGMAAQKAVDNALLKVDTIWRDNHPAYNRTGHPRLVRVLSIDRGVVTTKNCDERSGMSGAAVVSRKRRLFRSNYTFYNSVPGLSL